MDNFDFLDSISTRKKKVKRTSAHEIFKKFDISNANGFFDNTKTIDRGNDPSSGHPRKNCNDYSFLIHEKIASILGNKFKTYTILNGEIAFQATVTDKSGSNRTIYVKFYSPYINSWQTLNGLTYKANTGFTYNRQSKESICDDVINHIKHITNLNPLADIPNSKLRKIPNRNNNCAYFCLTVEFDSWEHVLFSEKIKLNQDKTFKDGLSVTIDKNRFDTIFNILGEFSTNINNTFKQLDYSAEVLTYDKMIIVGKIEDKVLSGLPEGNWKLNLDESVSTDIIKDLCSKYNSWKDRFGGIFDLLGIEKCDFIANLIMGGSLYIDDLITLYVAKHGKLFDYATEFTLGIKNILPTSFKINIVNDKSENDDFDFNASNKVDIPNAIIPNFVKCTNFCLTISNIEKYSYRYHIDRRKYQYDHTLRMFSFNTYQEMYKAVPKIVEFMSELYGE